MFPFSFSLLLLQISVLSSFTQATPEPKGRNVGQQNNIFFTDDPGEYGVNVTIAGTPLTLIIDTGSTDIYILPQIGPFNDTGANASVIYGDGTRESGTVGLAPFEIAGLKIPAQAFINTTSGNSTGFSGLIGFGFDNPTDGIPAGLNAIGLNGTRIGKSAISNIFDEYPDKPRFFAVSLTRLWDNESDGVLTIGEYDDRYSEVQHAPVLPQFPEGNGKWSFLIDGIFVNSDQVPWPVDPNGTVPDGQAQVILDTGTTHIIVPSDVRDFIYNIVPDAIHTDDNSYFGGLWIIPCTTAIDVHVVFGGQNFTVHPLDLATLVVLKAPDGQKLYCMHRDH
ncbi:aspartic peptidase domain-containing protein [Mycena filopes]|nr:aspartic peptidase domain-containing protein [Mycena filopes]